LRAHQPRFGWLPLPPLASAAALDAAGSAGVGVGEALDEAEKDTGSRTVERLRGAGSPADAAAGAGSGGGT
jgi:hypothetical protein